MAPWDFQSIDHNIELYLIHTDDRYGEWGGNTSFIRVYRDENSKQLYIDYKEFKGQPGPPPPPSEEVLEQTNPLKGFSSQTVVTEKIKIPATEKTLHSIEEAIKELVTTKLENTQFVAMGGIVNRVLYSDSSFTIEDYPSTNWKKFQELKAELVKD